MTLKKMTNELWAPDFVASMSTTAKYIKKPDQMAVGGAVCLADCTSTGTVGCSETHW